MSASIKEKYLNFVVIECFSQNIIKFTMVRQNLSIETSVPLERSPPKGNQVNKYFIYFNVFLFK